MCQKGYDMKRYFALIAAAALLLTGCGEKEVSVSVTLVNHSGHDISSISITRAPG